LPRSISYAQFQKRPWQVDGSVIERTSIGDRGVATKLFQVGTRQKGDAITPGSC